MQTFKQNAAAFPASPNTHDSLGDAYCRVGEVALGRHSYQEAARVAGTRSRRPPRLGWHQDQANKGCAPIAAGNRPE